MYVTANGNFPDIRKVGDVFNSPSISAFNASQPPPSKEHLEALDRFEGVCNAALTSRSELIKRFMDPRRDINDECGYPKSTIDAHFYQDLFDREPVSNRVVTVFARECWQVTPLVFETEDVDEITEFEKAWDELGQSLRGEQCWYQDEQGSPVWEYLKRLDIQSGIGHFGVLLLGFDDGLPYSEPVGGVGVKIGVDRQNETAKDEAEIQEGAAKGSKPSDASQNGKPKFKSRATVNRLIQLVANERASPPLQPIAVNGIGDHAVTAHVANAGSGPQFLDSARSSMGTDAQYYGVSFQPDEPKPKGAGVKLKFVRVFPESLVQVVQWESNLNSPRFSQPIRYSVTFNDPREQHSGVGLPLATVYVHWTRIIHCADNLNASEAVAAPRMRPVLNRLLDLRKLYGGSAEMYWRGAFPGFALSTHPQMGGDVQVDVAGIRDMMENYMNGLQRYLALMGMSAQSLAPQVVSPVDQINVQIEAICICIGIPKRVFMGSERGELASSQDDAAWNDRLRERQNNYITPKIIIPFIDRLIAVGVLPEPGKRPPLGMEPTLDEEGNPIEVEEADDEEGSNEFAPKKNPMAAGPNGKPAVPGKNGKPAVPEKPFSAKRAIPAANAFPPAGGGPPGKPPGSGGGFGGPPGAGAPAKPAFKLPKTREKVDLEGMPQSRLGYSIQWPDLTSQTTAEKAAVASQETTALASYISGGLDAMIQPKDFLIEFMGKDEEKAEAMLQATESVAMEKEAEELMMQEEQAAQQEEQVAMAEEAGLEPVVPGFTSKNQQPVVVAPGNNPPGQPSGKGGSPVPSKKAPPAFNVDFDSLPREAQKAAFANMNDEGIGAGSVKTSKEHYKDIETNLGNYSVERIRQEHAELIRKASKADLSKLLTDAGYTPPGSKKEAGVRLLDNLISLKISHDQTKQISGNSFARSYTGVKPNPVPAELDPVVTFSRLFKAARNILT